MAGLQLNFCAVSIDTNLIQSCGWDFEKNYYPSLHQFKEKGIRFLLSDIVVGEVENHLIDHLKKAYQSVEAGLNKAQYSLQLDEDAVEKARELLLSKEAYEIGIDRLYDYLDSVGVEVIDSDGLLDVSRMLKMYFREEPPFESRKKEEFPDAIALLSLEKWAEENDANILIASKDSGWSDFSYQSNRIAVVETIPELLEHFQQKDSVQNIILSLQRAYRNDESNELLEYILSEIEDKYSIQYVRSEAWASFEYDEEDFGVEHLSTELLLNEDGNANFTLIEFNKDKCVLQIESEISYNVWGQYDFYTKDWIDKDYVRIDSMSIDEERTFYSDILITIEGEFEGGEDDVFVSNVEVLNPLETVHLGELEPFADENPYHEKY